MKSIRLRSRQFHRVRSMGSRGDTIVEVLIAIGIVSLILTAAYTITNRNTNATLDIQEQGVAVKMAERQVELLGGDPSVSSGCFDISGNPAASCAFTSGGATYNVSITKPSAVHVVKISWEGVGGTPRSVIMHYRAIQ